MKISIKINAWALKWIQKLRFQFRFFSHFDISVLLKRTSLLCNKIFIYIKYSILLDAHCRHASNDVQNACENKPLYARTLWWAHKCELMMLTLFRHACNYHVPKVRNAQMQVSWILFRITGYRILNSPNERLKWVTKIVRI